MAAALQVLPCLLRAPSRPFLWGPPVARMTSGMALAEQARQLFDSAVSAVQPGPMLQRTLSLDPSGKQLKVRDRTFQLQENLYLVGFGKAVLGMAAAADELLGQHLVQGVISVPKGIRAAVELAGKQEMLLKPHSHIQVFEGAEDNLPDQDALRAAQAIQQLAERLTADDLLLVLISGGGSALLPAPIPPVTLEEKQTLTKLLAARGATIQELNTIRKALSQLKGGGLAQAAYPAQVPGWLQPASLHPQPSVPWRRRQNSISWQLSSSSRTCSWRRLWKLWQRLKGQSASWLAGSPPCSCRDLARAVGTKNWPCVWEQSWESSHWGLLMCCS